jgi:diguanylate cyclase (GGDEF)-like protein/PAS domain S-box-containing protein
MEQCVGRNDYVPGADGDPCHFPLLARAIGYAGSAILITDAEERIVWANDAFCRLSGYRGEEIVGSTPALFHGENNSRASYRAMSQSVAGRTEFWRRELSNRRRDGTCYVTDEIVTPLIDHEGVITHYVSILHDVTQSKEAQQRERALASQDTLTGLASRAHLLELFERAVREAQLSHQILATLFVDLDGFKGINDTHGHHIGDAVLKAIAARLQSAVRCSDTVARFGGDEFVILLPTISRRGVARRLGRKIVKLASQPFAIGAGCHSLSASVGIAFYPDHGASCESLLISADQAMYRAKRHGGSQFQLADPAAAPLRGARIEHDDRPDRKAEPHPVRDPGRGPGHAGATVPT